MVPLLQAADVAYAYPQHGYGLSPTSLRVAPGEAVHVAGRSGSGKSTLARCLCGLIPHLYHGALEGKVHVDGLPTRGTPLWQLADRAGLVFQNPAAQMLTVTVEQEIIFGLENLGLSRETIDQRVEAALTRFGLEGFRGRSPHTLSGGEQQKLALAAITARQPPILILDEPLSMLDSTASMQLVSHLADLTAEAVRLIIPENDRTRNLFITGGFSKNPLFIHLMASQFPDKKVRASEVSNATSLGAALVIWKAVEPEFSAPVDLGIV